MKTLIGFLVLIIICVLVFVGLANLIKTSRVIELPAEHKACQSRQTLIDYASYRGFFEYRCESFQKEKNN